ncbi:Regulator of nonsense transcripts 1-like protein [Diplonema papillatum]|nr:Regulator of nonsense transcripts 1-like protein [Diplonema papillatum]KAJ9461570.1 Regulator of nonsense transcripts 1-like protein [Diplonema papillatum]
MMPSHVHGHRFSDDCDAMFRIITKITKAGGGAAESDLATTDAPANSNTFNFMFYPPLGNCTATMARKKKKAQFIAYIGTHLLEYSSIQEFKNLEFNAAEQSFVGLTSSSQLLQSVLDPRRRFQGLWRRPESDAPRKDRDAKRRAAESSPLPILDGFLPPRGLVLGQLEPLNSSQNSVIDGLHGVLEVIHGPPGTGKSTTISYLIQERLSETDKILVTCTRNGAVDSLAAKLQGRIPMLVVGSKGTVGEVANEWRLPEQLRRHPGLQRCTETLNLIETFVDGISKAFERHEKALKSRGRYLLLRYTMPRHSARKKLVLTMYEFAKEKLLDAQARVGTLRRSLAQLVWKNTRVFVCTVAASVRLYTDYVQCHNDSNFTVDTVVVDECGCTSETATAVLLKLKPRQLLLLGDHKQLPAFSLINGSDTNHAQSLMERLVKVSPSEKVMLTEQYRMHPHICKLVSHLFYDKRLLTAAKRKKAGLAKKANGLQPLTWVDHTTKEEKPEGQSFSFVNHGEVEMVKQIILSLTRNKKVNKDISIAAMAFYRAQCALMTEELKGLNVEVATVDSVQGREFDVVILSCVRSNKDRDIGFLRDLPRMCVSLSRAREALYIVGDAKTLTCNPNWKMVHNYITAPNKDKYQLDAAIGDTSVVREGGIVPDHIVPRSRPQAQSNAGNASSTNADGSAARKDDDDFFVYYDPVAARRGVLIPAAWHQKEALRQAGSGGVGPQGPMPYNPKQLANGRNLYNAQNSHGGGHGHQGGAGGGGDAKGGGGQTGAGAGSQGPVPPPQQQQQSQQTWTDVWPSLQPTFTITVGGKPTPPAAPAAGSSTSSAQPAPAQPLASAAAAALSHASPAAQAAPALPANGTAAVTIPFAAAGARGPPQHHAHHHSQKPKPKRGPIHGGINIPATFAAPAAQKPVDLTFPAFAQFPDASLAGFSAFNGLQQTGAISQTPVWNPLTSSYVPQSCYATEYSAALGLTTQLPNSAYHPLPSQNAGQYWYGNQYY